MIPHNEPSCFKTTFRLTWASRLPKRSARDTGCRRPPQRAARDENLFRQSVGHRQEMAADRRRRLGARPARLADRDAAARQAQAILYAAYGLRRPCRRGQRREGAADRQQGGEEHLLLAYRLSRRHQGAQQGRDPGRQASRAGDREGGRADGAARAARASGHAQSSGLCRAGASACGAEPPATRYRRDEPPECAGVSMADDDTPEKETPEQPASRRTAQRRGAQTFEGLGSLRQAMATAAQPAPTPAAPATRAVVPEDVRPIRDELGRSYATGKRKHA